MEFFVLVPYFWPNLQKNAFAFHAIVRPGRFVNVVDIVVSANKERNGSILSIGQCGYGCL
jgi:hypothetical protein